VTKYPRLDFLTCTYIITHHTSKTVKYIQGIWFPLTNISFNVENSVGRPKHVRVMAGALEGELFIGPRAEEHRGLLAIKYPMEHGIVTDWNDMERIWQYIFSKEQLQTFSEEVLPI